MKWELVGWAHQLRAELAAIAPDRDKGSDGSIGDAAHQKSSSGHNPDDTPGVKAERSDSDGIPEVRAIDIDRDLRVPGLTMQMLVAYVIGRCRAGLERRLIYVIWDRTIWSASSGWVARRYTGSSPHTEHAHLSGHPDYDSDRRPWGLASLMEGLDMPLNQKDLDGIRTQVALGFYDALWVAANGKPHRSLTFSGPGSVGSSIKTNMAALTAGPVVAVLADKDLVDEAEIATAVLAGLGSRPAADVAQALIAAGQDPTRLAAELSRLAGERVHEPAPGQASE